MPDSPTSALDSIKNFAKATVSNSIDASTNTIYVTSGGGSKFPNPTSNSDFNMVIWAVSQYPDPADDPNVEIVRCTARSGDTFTVTRPNSTNSYLYEGSANIAQTHSNSEYTYVIAQTFSKKMKDDIESGIALTGMIVPFAGTASPEGWLLCDGTAYSRTTYSKLYAAVSTIYGNGDGSTTFNVPDLKGRCILGIDYTNTSSSFPLAPVGSVGGSNSVTLTTSQMPTHGDGHVSAVIPGLVYTDMAGTPQPVVVDVALEALGSGSPHSNLQPYMVMNYIIKY